MARKASSTSADFTANLGFETDFCPFGLGHSEFVIPFWVQHFIHHVAPQGMGGFVLANASMSSSQSGEGDIHIRPSRAAGIPASNMTPISD